MYIYIYTNQMYSNFDFFIRIVILINHALSQISWIISGLFIHGFHSATKEKDTAGERNNNTEYFILSNTKIKASTTLLKSNVLHTEALKAV